MIERLKELLEIQGNNGNWNYDPYMHGMYNGMELMVSMLENREPIFRDKPIIWLADKSRTIWLADKSRNEIFNDTMINAMANGIDLSNKETP
jgi:hypothetical protein